jgi:hypothetical protein
MQMGVGVQAEALEECAPRLFWRRRPYLQLRPPKSPLQVIGLVRAECILTVPLFLGDILLKEAQHLAADFEEEVLHLLLAWRGQWDETDTVLLPFEHPVWRHHVEVRRQQQ